MSSFDPFEVVGICGAVDTSLISTEAPPEPPESVTKIDTTPVQLSPASTSCTTTEDKNNVLLIVCLTGSAVFNVAMGFKILVLRKKTCKEPSGHKSTKLAVGDQSEKHEFLQQHTSSSAA